MAIKNQVQLITYVDRISGAGLNELNALMNNQFKGLFGGVHMLPFFEKIDGEDAGFDPTDHTLVDSRLGDWDDVKALGEDYDVMADLIINHVAAESPQFQDYLANGRESKYASMFLHFADIFPNGATEQDLVSIYRPRPGFPWTKMRIPGDGTRMLWTTFTPKQIDINVADPEGERYINSIIEKFSQFGVNSVRLDAAGYAVKTPGTSCFMTPETFEFLGDVISRMNQAGIEVLVEIHSYFKQQIEIAKKSDFVYDFALPPLVLHTLYTKNASALKTWLSMSPRNCITVLDTHDGIGIVDVGPHGELPGLLNAQEIDALVETMHDKTGGQSRESTGAAANNLDIYQVNATFYSALACDDHQYLLARLMQFLSPGIPQIYYVGLLAGENDMDLLRETRVGRDINRHYYSVGEIESEMKRPVVQQLFNLIKFRNTHPAFQGEFSLNQTNSNILEVVWSAQEANLKAMIDFNDASFVIHSNVAGEHQLIESWDGFGPIAFNPN